MKKMFTINALIAITLALSLTVSARQNRPSRVHLPIEDRSNECMITHEETIGMKVEPTTLGNIALRSTQTVNDAGDKILVFADYTYDSDSHMTQKNEYTFDSMNRQTSMVTYIRNDYSQDWMWDREDMICSYKMERTLSTAGYATYYESYDLDWSTGKLKGTSKYFREFNDRPGVENFITMTEYLVWNDSTDNWVEDYKYNYEYEFSGNEMFLLGYTWSWDESTKTWTKSTTNKYTVKYVFQNNYWFETESKDYSLINDVWVCEWEYTAVPNISTKSNQSEIYKTYVNDQLVNDEKYVYTYTATGRNSLTEYYRWKDNAWGLLNKYVYEYSTPDSVVSQTNYRTPAYYQYYGYTQPNLCIGQTLYPYQKYISKSNPAVFTEMSYVYNWDNTTCNWEPGGSKIIYTLDASGKNPLTLTQCTNYTTTDWINCELTTYSYYPNGKVKETILSTDGYPEQQKSVYAYLADSLLTRIDYYIGEDYNSDGLISEWEWVGNGYKEYLLKYNRAFDTDSVHITVQKPGMLALYNLEKVSQLKVTGPIRCEDLKYIAELSWNSLLTADLSDATIEGDTLYEDCFGKIGLNTLILPKNLLAIGSSAIYNSNYDDYYEGYENGDFNLTTLIIYPSVEFIAKGGIQAMQLKNITIKSDLLQSAFDYDINIPGIIDVYKTTLKSVTFNDLSGKIKDAVCYNMPYLKSVTVLDGVSEIGNNAFKSCGMLSSIQLPPTTLRKIGYNAFWGCNELTSLAIPEGTTSIDYSAFWGCSGVTSINMPSTLSYIAQNAFWGCSAVSNMNVVASVPPALGNNALIGIPRSASLVVPPSGFEAYKSAPQWKEFYIVKSGLTVNDPNSILLLGTNNQLQLQNIPENSSVQVFNMAGVKLIDLSNPGTNITLDLAEGLYLVKIGDLRFKTVVQK